jgi:glycosyltransferase involved in cell wall biosynthesis
LGVATGWGPDKGTLDYIELSKHLAQDIKIVLVGTNKEVANQMPSNILCLPRTNSMQELVDLYSMADILMSLSYQESMGLTPVEAMACGTPAIVYDNTAQPEIVDESTGIVVETGNVERVIDAIRIIKTKGKNSYKEACRKRAINIFDSNKCYHEYIQLYKTLLKYD